MQPLRSVGVFVGGEQLAKEFLEGHAASIGSEGVCGVALGEEELVQVGGEQLLRWVPNRHGSRLL